MKRGIIFTALLIFLVSFISAEIIFTQQVKPIYNLGDVVDVPVTIKTFKDISGVFHMDLICNGTSVNFYKYSGIKLSAGEEKNIDSSLLLVKNIIGNEKGLCRIKAILGGDYILTDDFKISDSLNIEYSLQKTEFEPEEIISLLGKVTKETGEKSNGFLTAKIISENYNIIQEGTINNGNFDIKLTLPSDIKAKNYVLQLTAIEKDSDGIITNSQTKEYDIKINQRPNNLELIFENRKVSPEDFLRVKAILHDQTGESIESTVFITIKNSANKILEQKEIATEEYLEYPIKQSELPSEWEVFAVSNKLSTEANFSIIEKENIELNIINRTIYVKNTGNVFYNKTILVQIEDNPLNLQITLKIGESKKYVLNAPDGEYNIRIISEDNEINEFMSLTGKVIEVKEIFNYKSLNIYLWIILILFLILIVLISFKKVYKKKFFGRAHFKDKPKKEIPVIGEEQTKIGNKAEISLSIKGEKQDASFVCVRIKNLKEVKSRRGSGYETLDKIRELGEQNKATIYENQDYLFFILTPAKTRTFKNEKTALELAEKIQERLFDHNRRFNEKIKFGISLDYGTIVGKIENGIFKFMSMGPLVTSARKIASLSNEKILLSEKMNELLRLIAKTEKETKDGTNVYTITKIKKENEEARKFIDKFMSRQKGN